MTDVASFCASLHLDEAAVRRVLESQNSAGSRPAPWYVSLLLGVGAWITALIMIVFVAVLLHFTFDFDEPGLGSAAIGAVMFVCGLFIQTKVTEGVFTEQFAIALVAAGAAIASGSIGIEYERFWPAAVAAAAMTSIDVWRGHSAQQQFLLAALAIGLGVAALSETLTGGRVDVIALALPIGVALYLWPPPSDMRPTATVLLLALPFYSVVTDSLYNPAYSSASWPARIVATATMLALIWLRAGSAALNRRHLVIALAAAAVCLLLPPGGSAALVILMLAFTLGHWQLAILGALLEIYFVPRFYYDLELSLLTKSEILTAVGVVLLAAFVALRRPKAAAP